MLVFVSILVGVGVTELVVSLHRILRARHRVNWDVLPLAFAALVLLLLVRTWWSVAAQPPGQPFTIGAFLPLLVELVLTVLLAAAVLPDEVPADGLDLRRFYIAESSYAWGLFALTFAWAIAHEAGTAMAAGQPLGRALAAFGSDYVFLAAILSLIWVRARWWNILILVLLFVGPLQWLGRSLS